MISLESLHLGVGLILLCTNPAPLVFIPLHFGWIMIALLFRCIPVGAGLILVCKCPAPPGFFSSLLLSSWFMLCFGIALVLHHQGLKCCIPVGLWLIIFWQNFFLLSLCVRPCYPLDEGNVVVYLTTYDRTHWFLHLWEYGYSFTHIAREYLSLAVYFPRTTLFSCYSYVVRTVERSPEEANSVPIPVRTTLK